MPRRVDDFRGLTQRSRVLLLHAVQRAPGLLIQELAVETGLPVNTARDHLRVLEDEGLVVSAPVETGRRGRPPMGWSPVQQVEHSPVAQRRVQGARERGELLRGLQPELDHSPELGAEAVHQLDALYEHLEDAGLEPQIDEQDLTVGLRPCIYERLMDSDEPVVCSVHARLVQTQLEQAGGPLELQGQLVAGNALSLGAGSARIAQGAAVSAGGDLAMRSVGLLETAGSAYAGRDLQVQAGALNNAGRLSAAVSYTHLTLPTILLV